MYNSRTPEEVGVSGLAGGTVDNGQTSGGAGDEAHGEVESPGERSRETWGRVLPVSWEGPANKKGLSLLKEKSPAFVS